MFVLILGVSYLVSALLIHIVIWLSVLSTGVSERSGIRSWSKVVVLAFLSFVPVVNVAIAIVGAKVIIEDILDIPLHKEKK